MRYEWVVNAEVLIRYTCAIPAQVASSAVEGGGIDLNSATSERHRRTEILEGW